MTYKFRGTTMNYSVPGPNTDYWVVGEASGTGDIGYATNSNRTSWAFNNKSPNNSAAIDGAYGKDGNGDSIFVFTQSSSDTPGELAISSTDITDGVMWSALNLVGGNQKFCDTITWSYASDGSASGIWMVGRRNGHVYRSTDGASSFSEITLPNDSGDDILSIAGNGSGTFVTGQQDRLLISTDDGASFSSSTPFGETVVTINGVAYTNQTWIVTYTRSDQTTLRLRTASNSDLTTWSDEVNTTLDKPEPRDNHNTPGPRACIAAANGRVVIVTNKQDGIFRLDVDGTNVPTGRVNVAYSGPNIRDISTNGSVWLIVTEGGDIYESTDNGETFTEIVDDLRGTGRALQCITYGKHLPL